MASRRTRRISDEPSASGRPRSSRITSGAGRLPAIERRADVGRLGDPVAMRDEVRGDGRPGRLVVLDEEDVGAGPIGHAMPRRGSARARLRAGRGRWRVRRARCARGRRRRRSPRSCRGRSTGRCPSRGARRSAACRRPRWNLSKTWPMSPVGTPGPPSSIVIRTRPASRPAIRDLDRRAGRRVVGDVVEDVRHDRVEQDLVDADERRVPATSNVTGRSPSTGRSRSTARSMSGCELEAPRGRAAACPESIRLRSRTERTSRSRRWASPSMLSAAARTSAGDDVGRPDRPGCRPSPGCSRAACAGRATPNRAARS